MASDGVGAAQRRLRVGVLIDSYVQPAWVDGLLREIQQGDDARIVLVVRNAVQQRSRTPWQRLRSGFPFLACVGYLQLDARLFRGDADPLREVDATATLADVPCIDVTPRQKRFSDWFPDEEVDRILAHDLDVALRLGFRILRGRALSIARHGVWSYHHGDNRVNRGGPAGFWEVLEGQATTGAVLQVLNEDLDNGRVIARTWTATHPWSVQRNRNGLYPRAARLLPTKLRDLRRRGAAALAPERDAERYHPYSGPLYRMPSNGRMLALLARLLARFVSHRIHHRLYLEQWVVAYQLDRGRQGPADSFFRSTLLLPPKDRFWADPFVVEHEGGYHIFLEELLYRENRGRIVVVAVDRRGRSQPPVTVLERDHHLSSPCVFQWQGRYFMLPESCAAGRIDLYEAKEFPTRWEHRATLLENVRAVDPVLVEHAGRWWLFACLESAGSRNDDLHVFHAGSPLGPWTPHAGNPVRSDVRAARPAGRPFHHGGRLLRPAQDCSARYGGCIRIHEVVRLDSDSYEEVEVACIRPDWRQDLVATHTLDHAGGLTVVDAQIVRPRFW